MELKCEVCGSDDCVKKHRRCGAWACCVCRECSCCHFSSTRDQNDARLAALLERTIIDGGSAEDIVAIFGDAMKELGYRKSVRVCQSVPRV